jgi:hypothetical protein
MIFRSPNDPESRTFIQRWVIWDLDRAEGGRYTQLLGLNPLREEPGREGFEAGLAHDARQITDEDLHLLLEFEWRSRLTAAWLIGLDQRSQFRHDLADLLLASQFVFAGQGYCLALARFGQPEDAEILMAYLDHYLPRTDCHYDQPWALGALLNLDERLGTDQAARFLAPGGLWHHSAFATTDPATCKQQTADLCALAERIMTPND